MAMNLKQEADKATELLKNKVVDTIFRHRNNEMAIKFTDGTTLIVDNKPDGLELSITEDAK